MMGHAKPLDKMDDLERQYFNIEVERKAEEIIGKLGDQPQFLNSVAMRIAQHVLKSNNNGMELNDTNVLDT